MENEMLKEIMEECNLKEKIVIILFTKTIIKVYNIIRIKIMNIIL